MIELITWTRISAQNLAVIEQPRVTHFDMDWSGLQRLDTIAEESQPVVGAQIDWMRINDEVQSELRRLADRVKNLSPTIQSAPGHNDSASYRLFSYRTFSAPDADDAIVAGVKFVNTERAVRIYADLCGEESGAIHLDLTGEEGVEVTFGEVAAAARRFAEQLATNAQVIERAFSHIRAE